MHQLIALITEAMLKKVLPDSWICFQTLEFLGLIKEKVYHPICQTVNLLTCFCSIFYVE